MSTGLLYHAWGVRGYRHVRTRYPEGGICFTIEQAPETFCCSHCGSRQVEKAGQVVRCFRALPIGHQPVSIELPVQRLWSSNCGKTRQARVAFADERRSYTRSFERYVLELCRCMSMLDVAHHLGVGWDLVKDIQKRHLGHRHVPRVPPGGRAAFTACPISTGPLEGTNTKIKLMQRVAYGYRDREFFKLKIYALHKTRYELVG